MSPASDVCASCGHIFSDTDALDPCPECGGTERTLRRDQLVIERLDPHRVVELRRVEERRPDGSTEVCQEPVDEFGDAGPQTQAR